MMLIRCLMLAAIALLTMAPAPALTQEKYPNRPLKLIVGYAAGGSADLNARQQAKYLEDIVGVPVEVENVPGAGGMVAVQRVLKDADDHAILSANSGMMLILPFTNPAMPFDPLTVLAPVAKVRVFPTYLVLPPNSPYKDFGEIIKAAKDRPGTLTYGSAGEGSSYHIAMEQLAKSAGIELVHVPYTGSASTIDLLAGRLDMAPMVPNVVKANTDLTAVLNIDETRSDLAPDLPSAGDLGLKDVHDFGWSAMLVAREGMTPEKIRVLDDAFARLFKIEAYRKELLATDTVPVYVGAAHFEGELRGEIEVMHDILTDLGLASK
jgi:tripartite-type tricarboxylate transporter receptor subunit TctC